MRKVFFTSDTHYSHKNIIRFSNRPFANVEEMNEELIERYNSVVGKDDIVYHIGDFAFERNHSYLKEIIGRLNGEKHFVAGNHDKVMFKDDIKSMFKTFKTFPYSEIYVDDEDARGGKQHIVLCHYAMRVWNKSHHGSFHLYGHSHGSLPEDESLRSFDVGVDCWDYYPVSYEQVKTKMATKKWKPIDHHGT